MFRRRPEPQPDPAAVPPPIPVTPDGSETPLTPAAWWARWFALDYSWDGMAQRVIPQSGGRTLQQYWRGLRGISAEHDADLEAEGFLIRDPQGRLWLASHAPPIWADGTPSPKADPRHDAWNNAAILVRQAVAGAPNATPGGWQTRGRAIWRAQETDVRAQLAGAVVQAGFLSGASPAHINAPDLAVLDPLDLVTQSFGPGACFDGAGFFEDVAFSDCRFATSSWYGACFFARADFTRSQFAEGTYFAAARFCGPASFANVPFRHEANFESAVFAADAEFRNGGFHGAATFARTRFEARAGLSPQHFGDNAVFDEATFLARMDFASTLFTRFTSFRKIGWPSAARDWHGAFDQAIFRGSASFRAAGFGRFAAFDGARFEGGVTLEATTDAQDDETFWREVDAAAALARDPTAPLPPNPERLSAHDVRLRQLEGGCRVLKDTFGRAQARQDEQRLHRYELLARRLQTATPPGERWASRLYDIAARYGQDWGRPIWLLLVTWLIFAVVFWTLGAAMDGSLGTRLALDAARPIDPDVFAALNLSASRAFTFGLWAQGGAASWLKDLGLEHGPAEVAARLLGSLETALALALLFLFGLGLRRRFQIS